MALCLEFVKILKGVIPVTKDGKQIGVLRNVREKNGIVFGDIQITDPIADLERELSWQT